MQRSAVRSPVQQSYMPWTPLVNLLVHGPDTSSPSLFVRFINLFHSSYVDKHYMWKISIEIPASLLINIRVPMTRPTITTPICIRRINYWKQFGVHGNTTRIIHTHTQCV